MFDQTNAYVSGRAGTISSVGPVVALGSGVAEEGMVGLMDRSGVAILFMLGEFCCVEYGTELHPSAITINSAKAINRHRFLFILSFTSVFS